MKLIGFVCQLRGKNTDLAQPPSASSVHKLKYVDSSRQALIVSFAVREYEGAPALSRHSNLHFKRFTVPQTSHNCTSIQKRVKVWVCKEFSQKACESADLQLRLLEVP